MAIRLQTNISDTTNEWLNEKAEDMGVSKSALIAMCVEQYKQQVEAVSFMGSIKDFERNLEERMHKVFENYTEELDKRYQMKK